MNICVKNVSFSYANDSTGKKKLFGNLSVDFYGGELPVVILGPSGSGKTTLLKLMGGLLTPNAGEIIFSGDGALSEKCKTSFMFQESRLLPWLTVLENVSLPLGKIFGVDEGRLRAKHFLSLVSLTEKENSYPNELSGGQAQRVSMARAFAWPAPALFMDEPFQSLDIPLRINLMDNCLALLKSEKFSKEHGRLLVAVTHDPREAVYMGGRIIVLGQPGEGIVFDRKINGETEGSAGMELEREIIKHLGSRC